MDKKLYCVVLYTNSLDAANELLAHATFGKGCHLGEIYEKGKSPGLPGAMLPIATIGAHSWHSTSSASKTRGT